MKEAGIAVDELVKFLKISRKFFYLLIKTFN